MRRAKIRKVHEFLLFFLMSIGPVGAIMAQDTNISGKVIDSETQEAIPFASIAVYIPGLQDLVDGTITHDNGYFEIENINFGVYQLVVSFIGYESQTLSEINVAQDAPVISLGEINLVSSAVELEGVQIVGLASTGSRAVDRQTYRAEHFETTRGGTATDVLSRLPSLSVNHDGEVSLRGSTDFAVYLNGKPVQMEASVLLGQIPANSIVSIDVITIPTARFDAQGSGGIVNITTKQNAREGWSIAADGMAGGLPWANKTHARIQRSKSKLRPLGRRTQSELPKTQFIFIRKLELQQEKFEKFSDGRCPVITARWIVLSYGRWRRTT